MFSVGFKILVAGRLVAGFWILSAIVWSCGSPDSGVENSLGFQITKSDSTITIYRSGSQSPLLVQNAKPGMRPYLHPIMAPDGVGSLTELAPGHHKHQTGLYWGFTRVNGGQAPIDTVKKWFYRDDTPEPIKAQIGRDYFHNFDEKYWKRVSASVLVPEGEEVSWQTVYHMLDERGSPVMKETQKWTLKEKNGKLLIALEWNGTALENITVNQFDYGGLFLRMPWKKEIAAEVVNAARQRDERADRQRAMWVDVGMEVEGRDDWGHIAIFDHPQNAEFPTPWRIDGQYGVGPSRAIAGDWQIEQGHTQIIKHQFVAYTGTLDDVEMSNLWNEYIGSESLYSTAILWRIAQQEGKDAKFLNPAEAVEAMTVKQGFQVNAWASEPMITQPMAFCWDDRGRLWVAENRDYENRQSGFSNDGTSRILIIEDADQDGVADSRKVFLEGIPFPAAIAVGFDGLYLGAPPNLLFVPDKNQDDLADKDDIEVLLTGWGIRDRHETINSLHWGPDGWLYGLEGFATPSRIRKPEGQGRLYRHRDEFPDVLDGAGVDINGGVWRFHPLKKEFEVVAHGFSNPWGIDYDSKGQLFITACVIPHMFHVIPGGIYHRQGGQHFNPYVYQDIRTIVDHSHRSAHGGARIYQSDAFPAEHQGRLFMANIHEHAVLSDILEPQGSGFVAKHAEDFVLANNAQWIGFSMEIGPSGDLYVLDWHDADICGNSVLQKETGRIFRVSPIESRADEWSGRYDNLKELSDNKLAHLQTSKSDWHARRARVILQARSAERSLDNEALSTLERILAESSSSDHRLRALWSLQVTSKLESQRLVELTTDSDQYIRAWSIQFLCEDRNPSPSALNRFSKMAVQEKSPVVRLYLAAALQRIAKDHRWAIVEGLQAHPQDSADHNIPKMIWYGVEPLFAEEPERALKLLAKTDIPLLARFATRRMVDVDLIAGLIGTVKENSKNQRVLLQGFLEGLEGRSDLQAPPQWKQVYLSLSKNPQTAGVALAISQQFGDSEAAMQYLATLKNEQADIKQRNIAIRALAEKQRQELLPELPGLWEHPGLRIEAIRALAAYNDGSLGYELLEWYADFNQIEKLEVVQTMASRPVYGNLITARLKDGTIAKSDIPAYVARQLRRVVGNGFVETWGPIDELSIDKEAEFARYQQLITPEAIRSANLNNGKLLFDKSCGACHQMYREGGSLGPDLTGSNRDNLEYLLGNILDPNGDIQDDYRMVTITTGDGRTYVGNITSESDRQVNLRVVGQDRVVISVSDIMSRETAEKSMMPEGLLQTMTDQQVIELVAYLQTSKPLAVNK
ncbi:MAG: hypothetical protein DHS20C17_09050 [Cyclobacteriaceae bacterium]|nr:MAG: hypothetical protein DHS20C17_09050 [Cyclobacteriaceae bacterium]